ncbi:hypothetical protein B7P43_G15867 [Cryptotermes secundus]|uniref:Reverse transcriptase domain-containing protein n=1 Tax=Cryptotermes secundus TaxID=105785 RepID=A0A2J7R6J9_9NEOP|nr:hypothetical protein B7P43_G15867 [Cryptotermes secundus]
MKILLRNFNAKISREEIFLPTIGSEGLHKISNDNGVIVVNFATSKNLTVNSAMFPHCNIHKFTWTCLDRKAHNQIDHILIGRWHSSIPEVRSFRAADYDIDYYLVVAKVRKRLAVNKQMMHRVHMQRFNLKKLNEADSKEQYCVEISKRFVALENIDTEVGVNKVWDSTRKNIKISTKDSLGYYEMNTHKPWFDNGLKQGGALLPILFLLNFAFEHAIRMVQENQVGMILNGTHQLLVYADEKNLLGDNINTTKKNTQTLIVASKDVGLEENIEKDRVQCRAPVNMVMNLRFLKVLGSSGVAAELAASHEGLSSMSE